MKKLITFFAAAMTLLVVGGLTASADYLEPGLYNFACVDGGRYLNVYAGWDWDGVNVCVWDADGSPEQKFRLEDRGGHRYVLYPTSSGGRVLDANRGNSMYNPLQAGNNIDIWQTNDAPAQEWYIDDQGGGKYKIGLVSNFSLALTCDNPWGNGGNVSLQNFTGANNQLWYLRRVDGGNNNNSMLDKYRNILNVVGCQTRWSYTDASYMCGAYCAAYARSFLDNSMHYAGEYWSWQGAEWTWASGNSASFNNDSQVLSAAKSAIDRGSPAVVRVNSSMGGHYVLAISYSGSGLSTNDFTIVDPWDGVIKNMSAYSIHSTKK